MNRRNFIAKGLFTAFITTVIHSCKSKKRIPGKILGASVNVGHILRDGYTGKAVSTSKKQIVIIGGGVSGLSAARRLLENNVSDFIILDLEEKAGGNAAYGVNDTSPYPLGAHYIPTPNNDLKAYLDFLHEANVITGFNENGMPVYNEYYLCFDSQERLYINGRWQDGLIPHFGVPVDELKQIERFMKEMDGFRFARGSDGKDAFAIPAHNSSEDIQFRKLDELTMKNWMLQNNYSSSYLHWYANYCTRDDFGTNHDQCSAWAGIHYFAARKGQGTNAKHGDVLTWPEGNGFLVNELKKNFQEKIKSSCVALNVTNADGKVRIEYLDVKSKQSHLIEAEHCIMAVPQFVAARLLKDEKRQSLVKNCMTYVPWLVANLQVPKLKELNGVEMSWDNVIYNSSSLGYVDATHQLLQQKTSFKNITYYLPLTDGDATAARKAAQYRPHSEWCDIILADMEKVHPGISNQVIEINCTIWGHAMAQPKPGFLKENSLRETGDPRLHFAHTDIAGISIFEEAFYQGIDAANKIIHHLSGTA